MKELEMTENNAENNKAYERLNQICIEELIVLKIFKES